ncbi:MAG: hypothetical protein ACREE3_16515, partial [Stellaceae bacterium]
AWIIRFREHEPKEEAYAGLARFFDSVLDGFAPGSLPNRYPAHFEANYLAAELTRRQCLLFDEAIGAPIS